MFCPLREINNSSGWSDRPAYPGWPFLVGIPLDSLDLRYLQAILDETLRVKPPSGGGFRMAEAELSIGAIRWMGRINHEDGKDEIW